ncbi:exodeoxyribonuclease V, gamma subunit, partial [Vibrio parahaemolyticus V-223/04]
MEDDEPFVLGGLESYQMRDELLETLLETTLMQPEKKTEVLKHFMSQQRAQGKLPVGAFGDIEFETNRVQAEELVDKLAFLSGAPQDDLEIDLTFDSLFERNEGEEKNVRLTGWLTQCYQSGLIRYRSGKIRSQDYLAAWIDHLAMSASGYAKKTHLIGYDRKEGALHLIYPEIADAQYAKQLLTELVRLFFEGMTKPLPYFPKTALA